LFGISVCCISCMCLYIFFRCSLPSIYFRCINFLFFSPLCLWYLIHSIFYFFALLIMHVSSFLASSKSY
jgi:hypothetical protein